VHKLTASFVLAYHGCDAGVAEDLLQNKAFKPSTNSYDWLGSGIYFWEANPLRALEFAIETARREPGKVRKPAVIGAVLDLGYCLDLTTSRGLKTVKSAFDSLSVLYKAAKEPMPENQPERFKHPLDCAVINYLHEIQKTAQSEQPFDSVKGIFIERPILYPGSAFCEKNHIQIAIRNPDCIKGVFRVPQNHIDIEG
jgi:hypothetical protein